jgi:hypothetical protein
VTEEQLVDAISSSIAESLGVHPSEVNVEVDMETGAVEFTVASDNYENAAANQFELDNDQKIESIINEIEQTIPEVSVDSYDVTDDIEASLEFTVDANFAENDLTQAAWQSEQLLSDFDVFVNTAYVTFAPTFVPSVTPTTPLPTAAPSMTGGVAIIELSRTVSKSVSETEIDNIQDEIAETYGVNVDDIVVDVVYSTTGSISLDIIDDTLSDEQLEEAIEDEIAALLGIHEGNIEINIEDGVAHYMITSESAESAQDIQDSINEPSSVVELSMAIAEALPVNVLHVDVDEDIGSEIVVTVDTSGAENNLSNSARELEQEFESQGFTAQAENVFITAAPTLIPTLTPSTSPVSATPSTTPSITGAVSSISFSGLATEDISSNDIASIEQQIADIYGVDTSDCHDQ